MAVIDTEHGSASKYADLFDFDCCELNDYHPNKYIQAIKAAGGAGYDVLIIDSLTHAWYAELNLVGNFGDWSKVKPLERALIDTILSCPCHVIVTMRTKTQYAMEEYTSKSGKKASAPKRIGTAPIQASGIEYEFDISGEIDLNHTLVLSKSRCPSLADTSHHNPGEELAKKMLQWVSEGEDFPVAAAAPKKAAQHPHITRIMDSMVRFGLTSPDVKNLTTKHFAGKLVQNMSVRELSKLELLMENLANRQEEEANASAEDALEEVHDTSEAVKA